MRKGYTGLGWVELGHIGWSDWVRKHFVQIDMARISALVHAYILHSIAIHVCAFSYNLIIQWHCFRQITIDSIVLLVQKRVVHL
jgi:hypothetical protein